MTHKQRDQIAVSYKHNQRKPKTVNIPRFSAVILAAVVPVIAHAQMNQIFGALHSAQDAVTEVKNLMPQQDTAQQRAQQAQQQRIDYLKQHPPCNANCPLDAQDKQKYEAMQHRDQQQGQQQLDAARKIAGMCPDLTNSKFNSAERIIRCRNIGLTEEQQMTFVGGLPVMAQAYAASMVQDIYEDGIVDPNKGKAISDYYNGCMQRGTPCVRPKW
ncbi:Uncharacterised protein [Burkholderia pseudomallei]|uniref:hypothetical protein n=1 Tax=Burkholderia pseudomallei TaxID=28450 RepID=UPI000F17FE6A|nr:hypothetical protein [Burkholderia pseudomallei]CAJ3026754.1 Uncharacterised protein [Burkholderia pseudomallei]VCH22137.1 Uncharacterised protein [Burkholderia pseudomallei]VCH35456.1 Uncharacterised protein [Burkholderia pseudomallei]VCH48125.1 Uncharacterised protein [Burkholderia pseudomallei]VCH54893.1 Uncharacterised protein [Burkholderia pseudomallei]